MTISIFEHGKDKNSIFTACDGEIQISRRLKILIFHQYLCNKIVIHAPIVQQG